MISYILNVLNLNNSKKQYGYRGWTGTQMSESSQTTMVK